MKQSKPNAPEEEPGLRARRRARYGINAGFVEEIHQRFRLDPDSVAPDWAEQFAGDLPEPAAGLPAAEVSPSRVASGDGGQPMPITDDVVQHARVVRLIHAYRSRGHRIAGSDPLGGNATYFPELDPAHYGFGNEDLDGVFTPGDLPGGSAQTLRAILERLKST